MAASSEKAAVEAAYAESVKDLFTSLIERIETAKANSQTEHERWTESLKGFARGLATRKRALKEALKIVSTKEK